MSPLIRSICKRPKEVYPNTYVAINHDQGIHKNGSEEDIRTLYVSDHVNEEFSRFEHLVNRVNQLTDTMTHIVTVRKADHKSDPFKDREPSAGNGFYRGD